MDAQHPALVHLPPVVVGAPDPGLVRARTATVFVAESEEEAQAEAAAKYGRAVELRRDEDVLDTWFSSASVAVLDAWAGRSRRPELQRYYPGDVLVTGFDIIFFWVARMMMQGLHFMGDVPFRTVYIHALVRDERGQKMSKSRGNIIDPLELIDRYGCDALRFTLAALASPGRDIKLAESRVESSRNFATKLWNAARYAEMNGCALRCRVRSARLQADRQPLDRRRDPRLRRRGDAPRSKTYRFDEAAHRLYHFVWGTFCDWYLEFTKPILQGEDAAARAETQATTAWVLAQIVHLLHPIMPFITEEVWRQLAGDDAGHADHRGVARSAARSARSGGRGRDGLGGRGDLGDPRDPHRGQCAGRGAGAAARQGCRAGNGRSGSNGTASISTGLPGSSSIAARRDGAGRRRPGGCRGRDLDPAARRRGRPRRRESAARARRSAGSKPIWQNWRQSSATRTFSPRPSPRSSRSSANAKPKPAATATA